MIYRAVNELVANGLRRGNTSQGRYIHNENKKNQWGKLNYLLGAEQRKNDIDVQWEDGHSHAVSEVFNYVPMLLNYITLRGYRKILFVGHFNTGQKLWSFPRGSDRDLFATPSYKSIQETMTDPNIWVQFLPIVFMAYNYWKPDGYFTQMHTAVPPESRHRGIMNAVYKRYGMDLVPMSGQYKHGDESVSIETPPDTNYDCVIFAGVPKKTEDTEVSHHHIRSAFAPYCTNGFDIIDLNYQSHDATKHIDGALHENQEWLNEVFAMRSIWDDHFRGLSEEDKAIEYAILDNMISTYSTRKFD